MAMSGCFVYDFRIGHSHPFCIEYSFIWFLACVHWDCMNIGMTMLSRTKVHTAKILFPSATYTKGKVRTGETYFILSPDTLIASTSVGSGPLIICI